MMLLLKQLFKLGVGPNLNRNAQRRITLANQVAFVFTLVASPYFFIFGWMGIPELSISVIVFVSCFLSAFAFNYYQKFSFARFSLILASNLALMFYSVSLGRLSGINFIFFALAAIPFVFYEPHEKFQTFLGLFLPIFSMALLEFINYKPLFGLYELPPIYLKIIYLTMIAITFIILIMSIRFYYWANYNSEKSLENTLTKLKESNTELIQANTDLQTTLTHLEESHKLQAQMKSQTEFAKLTRQIAHEIKNPLHLVRGNAEIMVDLREDQSEKIKPGLGAIVDAVDRIEKIIDAMMRYGDSAKGFSPKLIPVRPVLEGIMELAKGSCKTAMIKLELNCPDHLIMFADGPRIGQALINLISNALQYTPAKGSITLSASSATFKSPIAPHVDTEGVRISVTDTGCGIPQDKLTAIFSPSISSHKAEHNFGLGLAIVFQTMTQSRGVIEVTSEIGKGTAFMLYLPAKLYDFEQDPEATLSKNWVSKPLSQKEAHDHASASFGKIETSKDDFFEFPKKWMPENV